MWKDPYNIDQVRYTWAEGYPQSSCYNSDWCRRTPFLGVGYNVYSEIHEVYDILCLNLVNSIKIYNIYDVLLFKETYLELKCINPEECMNPNPWNFSVFCCRIAIWQQKMKFVSCHLNLPNLILLESTPSALSIGTKIKATVTKFKLSDGQKFLVLPGQNTL